MQADILAALQIVATQLGRTPFYKDPAFWISAVIGIAGLVFSALAWFEAMEAKHAAFAAGRTVKLQTIAIELSEIGQKLDRVQPEIRFSEARDLLSDISRRLHRATSPFTKEPSFETTIIAVINALDIAQTSLKDVRPQPGREMEAPESVYYGIEGACSELNAAVADLIGLFERQTFDFGANHAKSGN